MIKWIVIRKNTEFTNIPCIYRFNRDKITYFYTNEATSRDTGKTLYQLFISLDNQRSHEFLTYDEEELNYWVKQLNEGD